MSETTPTLELLKNGVSITDIEAVVIKTATKHYMIKTGTEASMKARVDAGQKKVLRKRNTLLAQNNTADLIMGYDIELTDLLTHYEVVALLEGGAVIKDDDGKVTGYSGPVAGEEVVLTPFTLEVYCANRGANNRVLDYRKFTYDNCTGKSPVEWSVKDGEFLTPKYVIESCPDPGEAPMSVESATALPTVPTA